MPECAFKNNCPYLNHRSPDEIIAERNYLSKRVEEMEKIMKLAGKKIEALIFRLQELETEKKDLQDELNCVIRKPFKPNLKKEEHIVQDLEIKVKTTCFRNHWGYCKKCKKTIYPSTSEVISGSRIGPHARAVGGYFHYFGLPFRKVKKIFENVFGLKISHSAFINFDTHIAENGKPLYEQIKQMVRHSNFILIYFCRWQNNLH